MLSYPKISWGTKGDSTPESDLGAVIQDKHSQVDVEMLAEAADQDSVYEEALMNLKNRVPKDGVVLYDEKGGVVGTKIGKKDGMSAVEKETAAKDYYANVRTNVGFVSDSCPLYMTDCPDDYRFCLHGCYLMYVLLAWYSESANALLQGLLMVGILNGVAPAETFDPKAVTMNRTKAYLTFILAFTAITNMVVSCNVSPFKHNNADLRSVLAS